MSCQETPARVASQFIEQDGRGANAMRAFRTLLTGSDLLAYLTMMATRLVELRRVLKKPTPSTSTATSEAEQKNF
jgi:hypothetical protein